MDSSFKKNVKMCAEMERATAMNVAINALGLAPATTASASQHARDEVNKCGARESAKHDQTMSIPCSGEHSLQWSWL